MDANTYSYTAALADYAIARGLIEPADRTWAVNSLLAAMKLEDYQEPAERPAETPPLEEILGMLTEFAVQRGIIQGDITSRDLFDTGLMGILTPRPSQVIGAFRERYARSPQAATDWYYRFSQDTDYIRRYRIARDMKWVAPTEYGDLDITINLSKPEKDPRAIAAAKAAPQSGYPKCQLCRENEGYAGRMNHPARQNHRIIPVTIDGRDWFFQYSPYVYYNEHCIVFSAEHTPMKIDRSTFRKQLDFIKQFPHYFVGSNADLPIVGGSILSHDHFQGGRYTFAMERAGVERAVSFPGFEDVEAGIVKWPMSVIRLRCGDDNRLVELADRILTAWRGYTDEAAFLFAETEGEPHNTITPIARMRQGQYELDLVLRNNITTEEYPLGVYHPHQELHHIKKENIGLIEVMGLAVLPARLKGELTLLAETLVRGGDLRADETLEKHADWAEELKTRYTFTRDNALDILKKEVGAVFAQVLEHAGVYKCTPEGRAAFLRFIETVK
nr:UDP-glucose--hexose-1-phosphate uridylyltransferase [uncultured Oscillibacter sp.]